MWQWFKRKRPADDEIDDEIDYHLAMLAQEHLEQNRDAEAAQAFARRKVGNQTLIKENTREIWRNAWFEQAKRDLCFAGRMLGRAPVFYSLVVGILAAGIAATVSLFSLVDGVLLRPFPYRDPSKLVALTSYAPKPPYASNGSVSYHDYQVLASEASSFSELAVTFRSGWSRVTLMGEGEPMPLQGAFVSSNLFTMFGRQPILGRTFTNEENNRGERVVLISEALCTQRFGSSPNAIGKDLRFSGRLWRVIGVMPNDFQVPFLQTQLWAPVLSHPEWNDRSDGEPLDQPRWDLIGRLKSRVSLTSSQAEINSIEARLKSALPELHGDNLRVVSLREHFTGAVRAPLFVLLSAVGLLLSIACANVANLLLARASQRERELSIRTALGAGRGQLLRQLLTETMAFTGLAATLGVAGAAALVPLLTRIAPVSTPMLDSVAVNRRVLLFAIGISASIALILGVAAAWRLGSTKSFKESGRGSTETRKSVRTKSLLVVAEFAMATVLTSGALMLIRSFVAVLSVNPGFPPERILTVHVGLPGETSAVRVTQFYRDAFTSVARLPGIQAIGGVSNLFFLDETRVHALRQVEGHAPEPTTSWRPLVWTQVAGDYFGAMGIPLLRGRFFSDHDTPLSPPVAIVNETLARRYWPGEDPIGKRLKGFDPRGQHDDWLTVVGLVGDTHSGGLEKAPFSQIYEVQSQRGEQLNNLVLRTAGDPAAMAASLHSVLHQIDANAVIASVSTMEHLLDTQTAGRRFQTWLIGAFTAFALGLAALGVFAIMHYSVAVRTNELGIRMALGASPSEILFLIIGDGTRLAIGGILIGVVGALWSGRAIGSLLFHVTSSDPTSFGAAVLTPLILALLACYVPAVRASQVDPIRALRE
jgi:putative ABC transport system permease protein